MSSATSLLMQLDMLAANAGAVTVTAGTAQAAPFIKVRREVLAPLNEEGTDIFSSPGTTGNEG